MDGLAARFLTGYERQMRHGSRRWVYVRHEQEDYFGCRQFFIFIILEVFSMTKTSIIRSYGVYLHLSFQQDRDRAILCLIAIVMANIRGTLRLGNGNPCHSR